MTLQRDSPVTTITTLTLHHHHHACARTHTHTHSCSHASAHTRQGALMSCGTEAASRVAASTGTAVKVLATFYEQWAAKDQANLEGLPIEYVKLDPSALVADTPLEDWYRSGQWLKHPSPYQVGGRRPHATTQAAGGGA